MKKLNILLINCDWRDIFRNAFFELEEKLERDRLGPKVNNFMLFSWGSHNYELKKESFHALQKKTRFRFFRPVFDLVSIVAVPSVARRLGWKPDVIATYDFGLLPAAWVASKVVGGKVVMCINNQPTIYSKTRKLGNIKVLYSWIVERLFYRIPRAYFTINNAMKSYLEGVGIPSSKIEIFAMDTIHRDKAFIDASKQGVIRARYKLPPNAKLLMTVARLEAEKNYPRLLSLFATLPKDYYLAILGQGSLKAELEALCVKLDIKNRVFFAGFVQRNDIWNFYRDADAFILLSKAEALGVVFWEAMYMGVPSLGSTADGIVESLGLSGERGVIIEDADGPEVLARKLEKAISPSPERTRMLAEARKYVEKQISNQVTINSLYERI